MKEHHGRHMNTTPVTSNQIPSVSVEIMNSPLSLQE